MKVFEVDDNKKDEENVNAHAFVVNVVGGTLHMRLIEEGNVSISITSTVPGLEDIVLYEANNNDSLPLAKLSDALKSVTKWTIEILAALKEGMQA